MIKVDKYYYYKQTTRDNIYEAVIKVVSLDAANEEHFWGEAVTIIKNEVNWQKKDITLCFKDVVKEVTQEKDPEYFL